MTPKSYDPGAWPAHDYRITQPLVALRYFRNFFLPLQLSADTDHIAETTIWHGYAWLGVLFVLALIAAAIYCGHRQVLRPIAFGIYWYLLALCLRRFPARRDRRTITACISPSSVWS